MGAQIAAHLTNANVETILFELPAKEGDPNGNVKKALEGLKKLEPNPLSSPSRLSYIQPANYEQNLELLRECDLVIEAIAERVDWKSDLYRKVAPYLGPQTSSPPTPRACRSTASPMPSRKPCATVSAAYTSSIRRAICIWLS